MAAGAGLLAADRGAFRIPGGDQVSGTALSATHSAGHGAVDLPGPRAGAAGGGSGRDPVPGQSGDSHLRDDRTRGRGGPAMKTLLNGVRPWRHDLAGCLHACAATLLAQRGLDPMQILGCGWVFRYTPGDFRREEYYFPTR